MAGRRTRRPMPAVVLAVILSTVVGLVWFGALHTGDGCPRPEVDKRLDTVPPAAPQFTQVHVLNANGVSGEAAAVGAALAELGFAPPTATNDSRYPAFNLHCYAEIRFGAAGQAGARTLSLALPCAELVPELRPDARVDLALGTRFVAMRPTEAARMALRELAGLGQSEPAVSSPVLSAVPFSAPFSGPLRGGLRAGPWGPRPTTQFATERAQPVPVVDPDLLHRARQVRC